MSTQISPSASALPSLSVVGAVVPYCTSVAAVQLAPALTYKSNELIVLSNQYWPVVAVATGAAIWANIEVAIVTGAPAPLTVNISS